MCMKKMMNIKEFKEQLELKEILEKKGMMYQVLMEN